MRRVTLYSIMGVSAAVGAGAGLWLLVLAAFLLSTGGTYSRVYEDGSIACGIPVFTGDEWLLPALYLFGAPALVLAASLRTFSHCRGRLKLLA